MDGAETRPSRWVTFYDGPANRLTITALTEDRWLPVQRDAERSKPGSFSTWTALDSDTPLVVEVILGSNGYPVDPPSFLSARALGSPTVWPQERNEYLWYLDESPFEETGNFTNPWPDWSPAESTGPASAIEPEH